MPGGGGGPGPREGEGEGDAVRRRDIIKTGNLETLLPDGEMETTRHGAVPLSTACVHACVGVACSSLPALRSVEVVQRACFHKTDHTYRTLMILSPSFVSSQSFSLLI